MSKLISLYPVYKSTVMIWIGSVQNPEQLEVGFDLIHLFEIRFRGVIETEKLLAAISDLKEVYDKKYKKFFPNEDTKTAAL